MILLIIFGVSCVLTLVYFFGLNEKALSNPLRLLGLGFFACFLAGLIDFSLEQVASLELSEETLRGLGLGRKFFTLSFAVIGGTFIATAFSTRIKILHNRGIEKLEQEILRNRELLDKEKELSEDRSIELKHIQFADEKEIKKLMEELQLRKRAS